MNRFVFGIINKFLIMYTDMYVKEIENSELVDFMAAHDLFTLWK